MVITRWITTEYSMNPKEVKRSKKKQNKKTELLNFTRRTQTTKKEDEPV